jgi:lysophospholipase L1-like esterase
VTFYTLTRAGGPWTYQTLGFTAVNGAVLDGSASTPAITSPPDAFWAVGGTVESGITRFAQPGYVPGYTEPADGAGQTWDATNNQWVPTSAALSATYVAQTRTVRATWAINTPLVVGSLKNAEICWRIPFALPYTTSRWRLRVRNYDVKNEAAVANGASFVGVYVGTQAVDSTGAGTAGYAAAPTQAMAGFTLPADGSEYVSGWVTAAGSQVAGQVNTLLSLAYTGGDTVTGQSTGFNKIFFMSGGGSSSHVGDTAAGTFASYGSAPFDVRIEYEIQAPIAAKLVLAAPADSLTWGNGVQAAPVPLSNSWPAIYARKSGNIIINGGVGSSAPADWAASTAAWKWARLNLDSLLVPVDATVVEIGTNGLSGGTLSYIQGQILGCLTALRALGVTTPVHLMSVAPRNFNHSLLANSPAIAGTVQTQSSLANGSYQIGEGPSAETVTVTGISGTGPYTLTLSAGTTKAHRFGETIAGTADEALRLQLNAWIRSVPGGFASAIALDVLVAASYDKSIIQPEFDLTDGLHFSAQGLARIADAIRVT